MFASIKAHAQRLAIFLAAVSLLLAFSSSVFAQGSLTTSSSNWGITYEIEDPLKEPVLTRESIENTLAFGSRSSFGYSPIEQLTFVDDEIINSLVQKGIFHADGRLAAGYFANELPTDLEPKEFHFAAQIRNYQVSMQSQPLAITLIRKSEVIDTLKKLGILNSEGHFVKDAPTDSSNPKLTRKEKEILRLIDGSRVRLPKTFSEMPMTQGFVVRKLLSDFLNDSLLDSSEKIPGAMRMHLANLGQIWQILSENPSLRGLLTAANLPSGDGRTVAQTIIQTLLAQPIIMNKLSQFAGEHPTTLQTYMGPSQAERRYTWLENIPDAVFLHLSRKIKQKIAQIDLSGQDAIKSISTLNASGSSGELSQLMQTALGHYFKKLSFEDKARLAKSYLALEPNAPIENQIAAALQATGPFVQKLFQLIGDEVNNIELQRASAQLKASVRPFPSSISRAIIERDLGQPIEQLFSEFQDVPIKAGTVGQIHFARLRSTGEEVAVKVLRPGVKEYFLREVELIKEALTNPTHRMVVDSYAATILSEMDLRNEAHNTDRASFMSRPNQGIYTTRRITELPFTNNVLVLNRVTGRTLDGYALFQRVPRAGELEKLLPHQVKSMMKAFAYAVRIWFGNALFGSGEFHGDFHTGNAMIDSSPANILANLTVIDFGNFQYLTVTQRQRFILFLISSFKKDTVQTAALLSALGGLDSTKQKELQQQLEKQKWQQIDANFRMAAAVGYATQMGARLPPEFVNFGRSKQMVETAIDIVNKNLDNIDPAGQVYKRLSPNRLFIRGALEEVGKSLVYPSHPARGDQRVFTSEFMAQLSREMANLKFARACREILLGQKVPATF